MPRAIWTGAISFGMVTVPVRLFSAVNRKTVRFHQLSGKTGARIVQKRVDPQSCEEVPYEDIVKGYELAPDRYVVVEPAELETLQPKKTKTIEIEDAALEVVVSKGYSMAFGARFLKRVIDERIKLPISSQWQEGSHFHVRVRDGAIVVEPMVAQLVVTKEALAFGDVA